MTDGPHRPIGHHPIVGLLAWFAMTPGFATDQPPALTVVSKAARVIVANHCPMLYSFGQRKPFQFHSRAWADRLIARPGTQVLPFDTGHWVMLQRPQAFNAAVADWLAADR